MRIRRLEMLLAASGLLALSLAGCGGGDSAPATQDLPVTVIDGAIHNALVCLDKNANGQCDAGEPSGRTAADGTVTLKIDPADAGKHPVLALVGTDAVDADHGAVTVAFSLKAPADAAAVVSPLTTLVQAQIEASGSSTAQAEAALQEQLGMSGSLMSDFTKATDDAGRQAATLARLVVVTRQEQATLTEGAKDAQGQVLAAADLEAAVHARLLQLLPALAAAAADAVQAGATPAEQTAAILAAARALATEAGLTKDNIGAVVAATRQPVAPDSQTADQQPGASLRWFTYTDRNNYMYRAFVTNAEQAVLDANGKRHFTEYRERKSGADSTYQDWGGELNNWPRNQIYWTGSEWFDCPTTFVHEMTPWSAQGEAESLYCKSNRSMNRRTARDVSGMKMIDLVKEIRAYPLADSAGKFSQWGPDPQAEAVIATLGERTFPAKSVLYYYTGATLSTPDLYGTTANDVAKVYPAGIASGEPDACALLTPSNSASYETEAATLDAMIAGATGQPCVYGTSAGSGPTNEAWGMSTVSIGDVAVAPFTPPGSDYKNNMKRIRASFGTGQSVTYHACLARIAGNSPRNCTAIGTGSYRIEAQGDARVLRFDGVPAAAGGLGYNRVFVERDGKVWYGSREKLGTSHQLRLNEPAADALVGALLD